MTTGGVRASTAPSGRRDQIVRLARYAATSVLAFAVSESIFLILYGTRLAGATVAALVANFAGTLPSYLMSRYWIWKDSARTRVFRQVVLYWTTSVVCIVLMSLATGAVAKLVPAHSRFHLAVVGVGFLVVNVVFWLGKFLLYHWVIFPASRIVRTVPGEAPTDGSRAHAGPVHGPPEKALDARRAG